MLSGYGNAVSLWGFRCSAKDIMSQISRQRDDETSSHDNWRNPCHEPRRPARWTPFTCKTVSTGLINLKVRTELNDIIIYKPFQYAVAGSSQTTLRFTKIFIPHPTREPFNHPKEDEDISLSPTRMVALPSVSGYSAVFLCGVYPGFILKTVHSIPRFHRMVGESVRSVCQFNVINGVEDGFLYYDSTVYPGNFLSWD